MTPSIALGIQNVLFDHHGFEDIDTLLKRRDLAWMVAVFIDRRGLKQSSHWSVWTGSHWRLPSPPKVRNPQNVSSRSALLRRSTQCTSTSGREKAPSIRTIALPPLSPDITRGPCVAERRPLTDHDATASDILQLFG